MRKDFEVNNCVVLSETMKMSKGLFLVIS